MNQFSASLWGDEAWAATLTIKPVWEIIQIVSKDTSPPLYYLLAHFWTNFFGISEISVRSLSFIFFLATVLTVYFIGSSLWDKKTGIFAAALTLVNPFLFQYAFEGRMYSLLLLTSTLSVYFFLKKQRVGFVLATAAALYTHHFSIFVVFFEAIWAIIENLSSPKRVLKEVLPFLVVGILYLPWIYPLYYQTKLVAGGFWLGKPQLNDLKELISKFLTGGGKGTFQNLALASILATLLFRSWLKDKGKTLFLLGWFFTPIILTFTLSRFFQSIFFDRYMLMVIPAAALLVASLQKKVSLIFILSTIALLAVLDYRYFLNPTKRPFRELAAYVESSQKSGDFLINYPGSAHHLFESKYYKISAPIYSPGGPLPFYTGTALMEPGDVIEKLPEEVAGRVGIIGSGNSQKAILPGYVVLEEKRFGDLFFLWLTPKKITT